MNKILVYKQSPFAANIKQLSVKRDWMDATLNKHAYNCFPISLSNTMAWSISFPTEMSFIWDGISDTMSDHVKVISGKEYCNSGRANATINFSTYLVFKTDENVTMLVFPVPNEFNENAQCFTNLISTSFYKSALPIAWRILKPNVEITVPANQPVAAIIPISLKELQSFEMIIKKDSVPESYREEELGNLEYITKKMKEQKFSHLYRNAKNYKNEKTGSHELKNIKLKTRYE